MRKTISGRKTHASLIAGSLPSDVDRLTWPRVARYPMTGAETTSPDGTEPPQIRGRWVRLAIRGCRALNAEISRTATPPERCWSAVRRVSPDGELELIVSPRAEASEGDDVGEPPAGRPREARTTRGAGRLLAWSTRVSCHSTSAPAPRIDWIWDLDDGELRLAVRDREGHRHGLCVPGD